MSPFPISPREVRYVKLGANGSWEDECRQRGILRFGYETGEPDSAALCREGQWETLAEAWQKVRKRKGRGTQDANEIRTYWTDPGDILWISFIGDELCWGFLEPGEPAPYDGHDDAEISSFRRVKGGWSNRDQAGLLLTKSNLPGSVTKVAAYRGTCCRIEQAERLVARINGIKTPDIERVVNAKTDLANALVALIRQLGPQDFELLIDMMFTRAGWRRVGHVGGNTRDKDLDLEMPLTGEKAFVQVKTATSEHALQDYVARFKTMPSYSRLFFAYHSSPQPLRAEDADRVSVLGPEAISAHVIEAGLVDWVVGRVY